MTEWRFDSEVDAGVWTEVDSPVSVDLHEVVDTVNGPCAVGAKGYMIGRASDGTWGVVVEDGPAAKKSTLHSVSTTDDGKRVWFAGANGAVGYYDIPNRERVNHSTPNGNSNTFHTIVVAGKRGKEKVMVADGSGNVIPGDIDPRPDDEKGTYMDWDPPTHPSGDTAVSDLNSNKKGEGYAVDSNSNVWKTTPEEGWKRLGIDRAQNSFYTIDADNKLIILGGGNGRVYESKDEETWTPYTLGNFTVKAVTRKGSEMLAAGSSGHIHYRKESSNWVQADWEGSKSIHGVALSDPNVAVGQSGTILERRKDDSEW